jgi:hypothetical protein
MAEGVPVGDSGGEAQRIDVGKNARRAADHDEGRRDAARAERRGERERDRRVRDDGSQSFLGRCCFPGEILAGAAAGSLLRVRPKRKEDLP